MKHSLTDCSNSSESEAPIAIVPAITTTWHAELERLQTLHFSFSSQTFQLHYHSYTQLLFLKLLWNNVPTLTIHNPRICPSSYNKPIKAPCISVRAAEKSLHLGWGSKPIQHTTSPTAVPLATPLLQWFLFKTCHDYLTNIYELRSSISIRSLQSFFIKWWQFICWLRNSIIELFHISFSLIFSVWEEGPRAQPAYLWLRYLCSH